MKGRVIRKCRQLHQALFGFPQGLCLAQDEVKELDNIEKCYNTKWFLTWGPEALFDVQGKCCQYGPEPGYKPQVCSGGPQKRKPRSITKSGC